MSSYDPESVRDMRPRTWLERWVTNHTRSHEVIRAEIIAECAWQQKAAEDQRAQFALRRWGVNHGWFRLGGVLGPRDAYIEEELAAKRAKEASQ